MFESVWSVFQRMCVFFLCDQSASILACQSVCLCVWMSLSICWFSVRMLGSDLFALRSVFRCCMSCLMWIGRGVNLFCWLPLGMWCLSAWSMTCVMIRFALCTSVGAGSRCMACSISCVNACQFAFL